MEILGVLRGAMGPGHDMIVAQLEGAKPEYTGVVAGMSGSPVYVDRKLVGSLAYRIGQFSKEPICGDYSDWADASETGGARVTKAKGPITAIPRRVSSSAAQENGQISVRSGRWSGPGIREDLFGLLMAPLVFSGFSLRRL